MIYLNNKQIETNYFPDGTLLLKENVKKQLQKNKIPVIKWQFKHNEEIMVVYFLTKHIKDSGQKEIILDMPYIPNARQDRVKNPEDVFTLKYFAEMINSLKFIKVRVLDAHSNVSLALIDRVELIEPKEVIEQVINNIESVQGEKPLLFYPDEGAAKRYSNIILNPYSFGIKKRDWKTGKIQGLTVVEETQKIKGKNILIVDDICSYGGTFFHSANALHELGAANIYLYISHCENSIFKGNLLESKWIKQIYTTDSILRSETNKKINVLQLNEII